MGTSLLERVKPSSLALSLVLASLFLKYMVRGLDGCFTGEQDSDTEVAWFRGIITSY